MSLFAHIKFSEVKNQFVTVLCANLLHLSFGGLMGWMSPALLVLQSPESPIGIVSTNQTSWLGSVSYIGLFFGGILCTQLIKRLGLKVTFCIIVVPNFMFWLIILLTNKIEYLYVGRILGGLSGGASIVAIPSLTTEIAENHVRGMLNSFIVIFANIGVLLAFITGCYMSYKTSPLVMMIFPIGLFVSFLLLPDTPMSLITRKKSDASVEKSLKFYLNTPDITSEVNKARFDGAVEYVQLLIEVRKQKQSLVWKDFVEKKSLIGFGKAITMVILNVFTGSTVLVNYASILFKNSGSTFDPSLSSIIMIFIQFLSATISTVLVDKVGRRPLLISSSLGTCIGFICTGLYTYFIHKEVNMDGLDWVPVASVSFTVFSIFMGLQPLMFVVLMEVLPPKVRDAYASFCLSMVGLFTFCIAKSYPIAAEKYQMYSCMWFFAAVSLVGVIFGLFVLEETKGKNINV